jgi:hypothetical protein
MKTRFQILKPKTVTLAVRAFYIGWILSVSLLMMGLSSEKFETEPAMMAVMGMTLVIPLVICLVFIPIWLFQNIASGKNWARIVWLVLVILNVPGALAGTIETFYSSSSLSWQSLLLGLLGSLNGFSSSRPAFCSTCRVQTLGSSRRLMMPLPRQDWRMSCCQA